MVATTASKGFVNNMYIYHLFFRFLGYIDKIGIAFNDPTIACGFGAYIATVRNQFINSFLVQGLRYSVLRGLAEVICPTVCVNSHALVNLEQN